MVVVAKAVQLRVAEPDVQIEGTVDLAGAAAGRRHRVHLLPRGRSRLSVRDSDVTVTSVSLAMRGAVGAVLLSLAAASPVTPHAFLVRSSPTARTTVARAPTRVHLWFNERLEPAYSRASIWNGDAQRVDVGDAQVSPTEPRSLSVGVPPLPAGVYTVKYRVLSVDGHVVEAEFAFTVRGAP